VGINIGEHSKDAVYSDAERRFDELEKETKKLHDESKKPMLNLTLNCCGARTMLFWKPLKLMMVE
jgi:hypothetical protein